MAAEYFVLDMGREQYGDSILCRFGNKTVLIDAGHPSDFDGQEGYDLLPAQVEGTSRDGPAIRFRRCSSSPTRTMIISAACQR